LFFVRISTMLLLSTYCRKISEKRDDVGDPIANPTFWM
jgi:hypothetical protein